MLFVGFRMRVLQLTKGTGNPPEYVQFAMRSVAFIFNALRYLIVLGLYAGVGVVVYGLYVFVPPSSVWEGPVPSVSPAVNCTTILTATFFMIYFLQAVSRTYSQYMGGNTFVGKFEEVMHRAADTLGMAPMLCALFLAARMRAP